MKFNSGRIICVFGLPCSGKSTIIKAVIDSSKEIIGHVSTGDIARRLSTEADKQCMADGNLFPHEEPLRKEVSELVHKRKTQGAEVIFIDGMPRSASQVLWLLEEQFAGTLQDGCFIQIVGDNLIKRATGRYRDEQDKLEAIQKKIDMQSKNLYEIDKAIQKYNVPYYTIINTDLFIAIKQMVKLIGLKK